MYTLGDAVTNTLRIVWLQHAILMGLLIVLGMD